MSLPAVLGAVAATLVTITGVIHIAWSLHKLLARYETIAPTLTQIAEEFTPNDGDSLHDRITSIEKALDLQSQVLRTTQVGLDRANDLFSRHERMIIEMRMSLEQDLRNHRTEFWKVLSEHGIERRRPSPAVPSPFRDSVPESGHSDKGSPDVES